MPLKADELIRRLLNETDTDKLYRLLIQTGKSSALAPAEKQDLSKTIETLLAHENEQIRSAAIRVLGFYWALPGYKETALDMFLNDQDEGTKADALLTWSNLYRNSNNGLVMQYLYSILVDEEQPFIIRETAYTGIFIVSPLPPKDWPVSAVSWEDFNNTINWGIVRSLLNDSYKES